MIAICLSGYISDIRAICISSYIPDIRAICISGYICDIIAICTVIISVTGQLTEGYPQHNYCLVMEVMEHTITILQLYQDNLNILNREWKKVQADALSR